MDMKCQHNVCPYWWRNVWVVGKCGFISVIYILYLSVLCIIE
jgi:hypothetical protein